MEATVESGKVIVGTEDGSNTRSAATRANSDLKVWPVDGHNKLYSVVTWNNNKYGEVTRDGKGNDINGLISDGELGNAISQIQRTLWGGKTKKPEGLDNTGLITDTKHVNTAIAKAYMNDKGENVTVENAEIWLTFLTESGWHQNTIGYYYYPSDAVPTSGDDVKKYILFPNTSIKGNLPFMKKKANDDEGCYDFGSGNAPLSPNKKIQLLYVDEKGNVSTNFPAGYTIGYFIIPKEYSSKNTNIDKTYKFPKNSYIYSNNLWNADKKENFISLSTKDGTVVYGLEDGGDKSYEDILFCIDSDPKLAIQDPDRPVIDPDEPIITSTETTYRTYAYEDIWPTGGDYDLNDVIIEHKRTILFNNKNYVQKVEDEFVPVQKAGAASFNNAFAVQYASGQRGDIELPTEALDESETSSVILFPDARNVTGQSFVIARTFSDETLLKTNLETDLNPFIIVNYIAGASDRTEVHLPKKKATNKANASQIGREEDAYYINKKGKYPFAIMVPVSTSSEAVHFTPVNETVCIDKEYLFFNAWVESEGATNSDWYLHYQSSK